MTAIYPSSAPPRRSTTLSRVLGGARYAICLGLAALSAQSLLAREVLLVPSEARRWSNPRTPTEHLVTAAWTQKEIELRVVFEEQRLVLLRGDARQPLPTRHTTLAFADGSGLLQYATSERDGSTEILWLDGEGRFLSKETLALGLLPLVALAADGTSVFAGTGEAPVHSALGRGDQAASASRQIVAFSPAGDTAWRRPIEPGRAVALAAIARRGEHSVLITADRAAPLQDQRIEVFGRNGEPRGTTRLVATAQELVLVPGTSLVWVQTLQGQDLFDLGGAEPELRWRVSERRCVGSPRGVAADSQTRYLFLIDRDCNDEFPFEWRLSALTMADGKALRSSKLDAGPQEANAALETAHIRPSLSDWILVGEGSVHAAVGDYFFAWRWSATP